MNHNNHSTLIGRLTADIELKSTANGKSYAMFSVAVDRPQSADQRQSGQAKVTDFLDVQAWGNLAERLFRGAGKGSIIFVTGQLQKHTWKAQDGSNRSSTAINADDILLMSRLPSLNQNGNNAGGNGGYQQAPQAPQRQPQAQQRSPRRQPAQEDGYQGDEPLDDPFCD